MDLEGILENAGGEVLEPANSVRSALALLDASHPDIAALDMNLNGVSSAPIAAVLRERKIPFLVVTGYTGKHSDDPMFRDVPVIRKPYRAAELVRTLAGLLS
jgi:CheY-like chemotaxis protein